MISNLSELVAALSAPDPSQRSNAAERLSQLGPDAQEAAIPLIRACTDPSEEVREWAVAALEELGPPLPFDVDELTLLLSDSSSDVGYWAASLLGRLEADAAVAAPALTAVLSSAADMSVRQRAAWALGKIGPAAAEALDTLTQAAEGDNPRLARIAARAIERIGG